MKSKALFETTSDKQAIKINWSYLSLQTENYLASVELEVNKTYASEKTNHKKEKIKIELEYNSNKDNLCVDLHFSELVDADVAIYVYTKTNTVANQYNFNFKKKKNIVINKNTPFSELSSKYFIILDINFKPIYRKISEIGLVNNGSTCYMNSILQVLNHIKAYKKVIFEMSDKSPVIASLQKLFFDLLVDKYPVTTHNLTKSFGWGTEQLHIQQDVQEFNNLLSEIIGHKNNIFEGELLNYINCCDVPFKSSRIEKFTELSLNISTKDIYKSFEMYTEEEVLDGNNMYEADKYGKQKAVKGVKFNTLSSVLILQLKRMEYSLTKKSMVKINSPFEFYETIDLTKFCVEGSTNQHYTLYAVVVHSGLATKGHYYSFIKKDDNWILFDDEFTRQASKYEAVDLNFGNPRKSYKIKGKEIVKSQAINESSAYLLIYIKTSEKDKILGSYTADNIPIMLKQKLDYQKSFEDVQNPFTKSQNTTIFLITKEMLINKEGIGIIDSEYDLFKNKPFLVNFKSKVSLSVPITMTPRDLIEFYKNDSTLSIDNPIDLYIYINKNIDSSSNQMMKYEIININSSNYIDMSIGDIIFTLKIKILIIFMISDTIIFRMIPPSEVLCEEFFLDNENSIYHSKNINTYFFNGNKVKDYCSNFNNDMEIQLNNVSKSNLVISKKIINKGNGYNLLIERVNSFSEDDYKDFLGKMLKGNKTLVEVDSEINFYEKVKEKDITIIINESDCKYDNNIKAQLNNLFNTFYLDIYNCGFKTYITSIESKIALNNSTINNDNLRTLVINHINENSLLSKISFKYDLIFSSNKLYNSQEFFEEKLNNKKITLIEHNNDYRSTLIPFINESIGKYINPYTKSIDFDFTLGEQGATSSFIDIEFSFIDQNSIYQSREVLIIYDITIKSFEDLKCFFVSKIFPALNIYYKRQIYSTEQQDKLSFIIFNKKENFIYNIIENNEMLLSKISLLTNGSMSIKLDDVNFSNNKEKVFVSVSYQKAYLSPFVLFIDKNETIRHLKEEIEKMIKIKINQREINKIEYYQGLVLASKSLVKDTIIPNEKDNDAVSSIFMKKKLVNIIVELE